MVDQESELLKAAWEALDAIIDAHCARQVASALEENQKSKKAA